MDVNTVNSTQSVLSNAVSGLKKADEQLNQAAQNIASGSTDPQDVVSLSAAANGFKANAAVVKTADEMTQSLLDIKA